MSQTKTHTVEQIDIRSDEVAQWIAKFISFNHQLSNSFNWESDKFTVSLESSNYAFTRIFSSFHRHFYSIRTTICFGRKCASAETHFFFKNTRFDSSHFFPYVNGPCCLFLHMQHAIPWTRLRALPVQTQRNFRMDGWNALRLCGVQRIDERRMLGTNK